MLLELGIIVGGCIAYIALGGQASTINKASANYNPNNTKDTFDYFNSLTLEEQQCYFRENYDLRYYMNDPTVGLTDDKYFNAKHAEEIARRTNKVFNNKNKIY